MPIYSNWRGYQSQLRISHFRRVAGRMLWIRWLVGNASLVAGFEYLVQFGCGFSQ